MSEPTEATRAADVIRGYAETQIQRLLDEKDAEIERLKDCLRASTGGCRILSEGNNCDCGLCKRDNEIERLKKEQHEIALILGCDDIGDGITTPSNLPNVIRDRKLEIERLKQQLAEAKEPT